jgi:uncharacterized protein
MTSMKDPMVDGAPSTDGPGVLKVLSRTDADEALELLDADPVSNVFVTARLEAAFQRGWSMGGQLWGYFTGGRLVGLCYSGANLVPVTEDDQALMAFAERARRQGRRCSSIVGSGDQVLSLWHRLEAAWGPAREVRDDQPLLSIPGSPLVTGDPLVRRVEADELDVILPACVDMFTEEVGVSPMVNDGGVLYRARVEELIRQGRAFARIENGQVLFKAEIGAVSSKACQVQGVWVHPDHRGQGLSAPGMATVVDLARQSVAPAVSLYVNGYNEQALRTYRRVGFEQVGAFATILF